MQDFIFKPFVMESYFLISVYLFSFFMLPINYKNLIEIALCILNPFSLKIPFSRIFKQLKFLKAS